MAEIRPFSGVRFRPEVVGDLARVVAAPYDIITPEAQEEYYSRSAYNVVRLELPRDPPVDSAHRDRYSEAANTYRRWLEDGVLRVEGAPSFYLYEEHFESEGRPRARRSLFAAVKLADWEEQIILPHEYTMPGPKADRLNLIAATHVQFSPLLGLYDDPGVIREALASVAKTPPTVRFTLGPGDVAAAATEHLIWQFADPALVARLATAFRPLQIFIADGHHRYETALAYRDRMRAAGAATEAASEFVLMTLVDLEDPGVIVQPTHRLLRGLQPIDREQTLTLLSRYFEIERVPLDGGRMPVSAVLEAAGHTTAVGSPRPSFTLLGLEPGACHRLTLRRSSDAAIELADVPEVLRSLDTVILQRLILEPVFGLTAHDVEAGARIQYTRDIEEAARAVKTGHAQIAVLLNPTPIEQIRAAARAGQRMPQKTTYFYPKPVTGLVFFDHDRSL